MWLNKLLNHALRLTGRIETDQNAQKVEEDDDEKDPEHIGFIKVKF